MQSWSFMKHFPFLNYYANESYESFHYNNCSHIQNFLILIINALFSLYPGWYKKLKKLGYIAIFEWMTIYPYSCRHVWTHSHSEGASNEYHRWHDIRFIKQLGLKIVLPHRCQMMRYLPVHNAHWVRAC